jgi:uncharacterized membrane protein
MVFGGLVFVALWVFLIFAVLSLATDRRRATPTHVEPMQRPPRPERPVEIAQRRFAAGEISSDEYSAIVETLRQTVDPSNPSSGGATGLGRAS